VGATVTEGRSLTRKKSDNDGWDADTIIAYDSDATTAAATWGTWTTVTASDAITGADADRVEEKIGLKWNIRTMSYLDLDTNLSWFVIEH